MWVLLVVAAGCSGGDQDAGQQVGPDVTAFVAATLDDVPVPPRAEALGPAVESDGGVRTRSWAVRGTTAADVLAFYREVLADRPVVSPVTDAPGAGTVLRGTWRLEDGELLVAVQAAPTVAGADDGAVVQLSLQLTPA